MTHQSVADLSSSTSFQAATNDSRFLSKFTDMVVYNLFVHSFSLNGEFLIKHLN